MPNHPHSVSQGIQIMQKSDPSSWVYLKPDKLINKIAAITDYAAVDTRLDHKNSHDTGHSAQI